MLQTLREKTSGWIAFFILAAVSIPFAFFGIEHYFEVRSPTYVAKIGKDEISQSEFRRRFEEYRQNARRQLGDSYDPEYFEQPLVKRQILEQLVDEKLLTQAAEAAGTEASDERVRKEIAAIPAFQVDGKFDPSQYQTLLQAQAPPLTVAEFESRIRRDLSARELPGQVSATSAVTDAALNRYLALREQQRDFAYAVLPPVAPAAAEPPQAEIETWFAANKGDFMTDEQVTLRYVELDSAQIPLPAEPDEATLRQRYEEQKNRFVVAEQREASHILVKVAPDADADTTRAAQEKAAGLAAQARAAGADFAALARANSDDIGSKAAGGDLGMLEKGITQPAFEAALFSMTAGQVSDPVKTDEGFHVIQLRKIEPERSKPFEEVRAELAEQYSTGERDRIYNEQAAKLIDQIYKDPTSIDPAARAIGAEVRTTAPFGRAGGEGIAASPAVLKEAFSDRVLADGGVSDPIELGNNHVVVIQLDKHTPRAERPLDEVRVQVVARMNAEAARTAGADRARAFGERFAQGAPLATLAAETGATVTEAAGVGRSAINHESALVAEVFKLPRPAEGQPVRRVVDLPGDRHALVELRNVVEGDPSKVDAAQRDAARTQLQQAASAIETRALLEALRAATEVVIAEDRM
jgi:peptidyl-prolyl cis-trans isomerase D